MMNLITKETQRKTAVRVLSAAVFVLLASGCIFTGAGAAAQIGFDGGIMWELTDEGVLKISPAIEQTKSGYPSGQMKDGEDAPWKSVQGLRTLVIEDGVTTIGEYAFSGCRGFTGELQIPDSVTTIGERAFSGCSGFTGPLTIPDTVKTIGHSAFEGCSGFTGPLTIPDSVDDWTLCV